MFFGNKICITRLSGSSRQVHTEPKDKNFRQDLQDAQDELQGSLETPPLGDPKATPWEQWEALEHKNKQAYFCALRVPIFSSDPTKPVY